jgi:ABC-type transporter Mla subunit MlaD
MMKRFLLSLPLLILAALPASADALSEQFTGQWNALNIQLGNVQSFASALVRERAELQKMASDQAAKLADQEKQMASQAEQIDKMSKRIAEQSNLCGEPCQSLPPLAQATQPAQPAKQ